MAQIDKLFSVLIQHNGSDLHLEQGQKPKVRINGILNEISDYEVLTEETITSWMKEISSDDDWAHFQQTGDLDFAYALGHDARFRANYFRHFNGYGSIFRLIPSKILTLEQLGMPEVLKTFGDLRSGLVVITGPTGSGKSTTLAAVIDYINETSVKKIITIEEPVEFIHPNKNCLISHREVGLDTESFSSGLRSAIKSDANVILVGEMRDQETVELALKAAEMGILVFGTLHTNSAPKTVDRIIDVFPAKQKNQIRSALGNSLRGVVAQQLLRSADGARRFAAYEILLKTSALSAIIRAGESNRITSEIQLNSQMGMILMDDCLAHFVKQGMVAKEDAFMMALDKDGFLKKIGV